MAENSKIEWTDHTFNPWIGCTKISPAYDNCYAESWAKRFHFAEWGGERRRTSKAKWREPIAWNRSALRSGIRRKVFCASLAGVFDNQVPDEWRTDLWGIIRQTTTLDWQLLTKRPQNIRKMLPSDWGNACRIFALAPPRKTKGKRIGAFRSCVPFPRLSGCYRANHSWEQYDRTWPIPIG